MITGKIHFHKASDDMLNAFGHPAVIWQGARVYLPVVLADDCYPRPFAPGLDHPCKGCESPTGWGRRWCYQLNQAVNADSCKRIMRKTGIMAWEYMGKRLLDRRRKRRDTQHGKANSQGQKRALAGVK